MSMSTPFHNCATYYLIFVRFQQFYAALMKCTQASCQVKLTRGSLRWLGLNFKEKTFLESPFSHGRG